MIELRVAAGDGLVDMRLGYDADPVVAHERGLLHGLPHGLPLVASVNSSHATLRCGVTASPSAKRMMDERYND